MKEIFHDVLCLKKGMDIFMIEDPRYQFSRESAIKEKLLQRLKIEYRKTRMAKVVPLDDDKLILVTAAGDARQQQCPYSCICEECPYFTGSCQQNLVKG
ncbi:hypothetical protein [Syntrophomonas wolfei]|uniref:hypothetical protein n=2 Tax=Syntrophomonas wolfei TaxID=863 RepID=UPI000772F956|nr:hypothetical protein [Syntrophomonas wolfei]